MEQKNNKGLIWLTVFLIILFIGLISLVVFNTMLQKEKQNNDNTTTTTTTTENQQRQKLTNIEKDQIEKFINKFDNYAFLMFDYNHPNNILRKYDNNLISNPSDYLSYSIRSYTNTQLTEQEIDLISDEEGFFGETYATTKI